MIRLSIITINFNNRNGLEKTIGSVIGQTFKDFEYIIIDGGSTDGSVEIIKRNVFKLAHWVSEPDKGIYNAMNKGIRFATGEYILFLNSGDYLVNKNILETVLPQLNDIDIVYGNGFSEDRSGKYVKVEIPEKLKLDYFSSNSLFHPSSFIKRKLFNTYGLYNESYKIVSDWEFFIKTIMVNNVKAIKIPYEIAIVEANGISRDIANTAILKQEVDLVLSNYFPHSVISLIDDYKRLKSEGVVATTIEEPNNGILNRIGLKIKKTVIKWKRRK